MRLFLKYGVKRFVGERHSVDFSILFSLHVDDEVAGKGQFAERLKLAKLKQRGFVKVCTSREVLEVEFAKFSEAAETSPEVSRRGELAKRR